MSSATILIVLGLGLVFLYGIGIFAMCLRAGENPVSSAIQVSGWGVAFFISHLVGYLTITLH
jgi:hypothetical protein